MSQVTLEMVRARQRDLAAMIDELAKREQQPLELPACSIALRSGEWYAGAALHADGRIKHHTIVCAADNSGRDHADANAWAAAQGVGYACPDKQDARLILANRHERLSGMSWFWLCDAHETESAYAWHCLLNYGTVIYYFRSAKGGAVAVRRVIP